MKKYLKRTVLVALTCFSFGAAGLALAQSDTSNTNANSNVNVRGQETTGQFVDNSALTLKVKAKLMADDTVKSLPITVTSYKGVVQLAGFVDDEQQVRQALKVARGVDGVKQVRNCLIVKH